jgi:hypothetical protein
MYVVSLHQPPLLQFRLTGIGFACPSYLITGGFSRVDWTAVKVSRWHVSLLSYCRCCLSVMPVYGWTWLSGFKASASPLLSPPPVGAACPNAHSWVDLAGRLGEHSCVQTLLTICDSKIPLACSATVGAACHKCPLVG